MSILGMNRMEALWHTPIVTVMRCQAAYMERHGKRVDWEAGKMKLILEHLEQNGPAS